MKFQRSRLTRDGAEGVAIAALGFLASDPERLGRFLSLSGLGPETLRASAREPWFFTAILDHVLSDEALVLAFAAETGNAPETLAVARHVLDPATE